MKFPPIFSRNSKIEKLVYEIDVLKAGYELHPISESQSIQHRRVALLKSSLFSARIEGNPLDLSDISDGFGNSDDIHKREIGNLVSVYEQIPGMITRKVSIDLLKKLHFGVLHSLSSNAGSIRREESAIYNQAGIAVYLTPAPQIVRPLLDALCEYINSQKDHPLLNAGVSHIWFEKIHPFLDGNGRVGRLVSALLLRKSGYDFGGIVPFEQYFDEHRDEYYSALGHDTQDVTEFVEFYLSALFEQAKVSLRSAIELQKIDIYAHLLPRRAEIMRLIEDHKIITFNFLARRFRAIPTRTLHFDISQLIHAGYIQKIGSTRGVMYTKK